MEIKHEYYMKEALKEAEKAYLINEVPVGCVIVENDVIIGRGYNDREKTNNVLGHAEIIAIQNASQNINSWRLENASLYVTLEPCIMCLGAMIQARIKNVYYAASDLKIKPFTSIIEPHINQFDHKMNVYEGILKKDAEILLKKFFINLRKEK